MENNNAQRARISSGGRPVLWALGAAVLIVASNIWICYGLLSELSFFSNVPRPAWKSTLGWIVVLPQIPSFMVGGLVSDSWGNTGWIGVTSLVSCVMYCPAAVWCCWWWSARKARK